MKIEYIIFAVIFIYIPLWVPINLFLSSLSQKKSPVTVINDNELQQLIFNKTGVNIKSIKISESKRPFGMMIGIPTSPQLILSRNLYETFSPQEMEYVLIHEAGHYKLWHGVIELIIGLVLLIAGLFVFKNVHPPLSVVIAVILGVVLGVIMIRVGGLHEYQADNFTVRRMTNPEGMIQATNKFKNFYGKSYTENNKLLHFLFYRGNPYDNRIKMAEDEIKRRQ